MTTAVASCDPGGDRGDALRQAEVSQAAAGVHFNADRRIPPPQPMPSPQPTPAAPFWQPLLDLNEMILDVQRHMRVLPGIGETYEVKDKRAHMAA